MMERALPGCRFGLLVAIPGSSLLAGRSVAAAPTIPLPEPGGELGLLPLLAILGIFAAVIVAERPQYFAFNGGQGGTDVIGYTGN